MNGKCLWSLMAAIALLVTTTPALTASSPGWAEPTNLSEWQTTIDHTVRLELGTDGTQAAFWIQRNVSGTQWSLWTRVRPGGGDWNSAENLSGWLDPLASGVPAYWSTGAAPDGTIWALWTAIDNSVPGGGDNQEVKVARWPPGGSWQWETLTPWHETEIKTVDLYIGPGGDLATAWVACAGTMCHIRVRRRLSGSTSWESVYQPDGEAFPVEIGQVYILVGPSGLTVVMWEQTDPLAPSNWGVIARAYTPIPTPGAWDASPQYISGWKTYLDLARPVMDPAGTVTAAWLTISPDPSKRANYSATRAVAGGTWNSPVVISTAKSGFGYWAPWLVVSQNGTVAAIWAYASSPSQRAVFANARDPGSIWGTETQLSNWMHLISLEGLEVWPGGTVMALWWGRDSGRPATEDEALFWSARSPSSAWGSGGQGQLTDWYDDIEQGDLELGDDGSAVAVWAIGDAGQPVGQQQAVQAVTWPAGGPWSAPAQISDWHKDTWIEHGALIIGSGGRPRGVVWRTTRDATLYAAVFYSEFPLYRVFLPLTLRSF